MAIEQSPVEPEQSQMVQAMLAEYSSLRDEIIHFQGVEFQIVAFALPITGALVAYGFQQQSYIAIFAAAVLFVALIFGRNVSNANYLKLSAYLSTAIEPKVRGLQWERARHKRTNKLLSSSVGPATALLVIAIVVGLVALAYSFWVDRSQNGLLIFGSIGIVLVVFALAACGMGLYIGTHRYYAGLCREWDRILKESAK